jgi:hypothetical protein
MKPQAPITPWGDVDDAAELASLRRRSAEGLVLTEAQRQAFSSRLMLQAPRGLTPKQIKNVAEDLDRRVRGLPPGAFMALDALRLLADGGNDFAAYMLELETERLGLTVPLRMHVRGVRLG